MVLTGGFATLTNLTGGGQYSHTVLTDEGDVRAEVEAGSEAGGERTEGSTECEIKCTC